MVTKNTNNAGAGTMGYPEVEKLIDSEDFDPVNETFEKAYSELSAIHGKKKGLKKSRDAKRGIQAIEHVADLFKELLEIKYELAELLERARVNQKKK